MPQPRIAIIGFSSANSCADPAKEAPLLNLALNQRMVDLAAQTVSLISSDLDVELVSGGAAHADDVAVAVFDKYAKQYPKLTLTLHFPAKFDQTSQRFEPGYTNSKGQSHGGWTNEDHQAFLAQTGIDSLARIARVISEYPDRVKTTLSHGGFLARNKLVAVNNIVIAFTWSYEDDAPPPTGGTRNTWDMCRGGRIHFAMAKLANYTEVDVYRKIKDMAR